MDDNYTEITIADLKASYRFVNKLSMKSTKRTAEREALLTAVACIQDHIWRMEKSPPETESKPGSGSL